MIRSFIFLVVIFIGAMNSPSYADENGTKIASCTVPGAASDDISSFDVFQANDANKSINVTLIGSDGPIRPSPFPADTYDFSGDRTTLQVRVAKYILIVIAKGQNTAGKIEVELGSPAQTTTCTTYW